MKKRLQTIFTILAVSLFFLQISFAQTISPEVVVISPLGEAKFEISVYNERSVSDTIMLEPSDVKWSLRTEHTPDFTTGIDLAAGASKETTIYFKPDQNIEPGTYYVGLREVSLETKEAKSRVFVIKVDPKFVDYKIKVASEIMEPTSIDPQKTNSVKLLIKNSYPVYLQNITVDAVSKFLNKKAVVDIPPKTEKIIDFSLNIDESTPKQEDEVKITIEQNGNIIGETKQTLYIKEYKQPYKIDTKTTKGFLYERNEITFTNTEGAEKTRDASVEKPSTLAYLFTTPAAVTEEFSGKEYLVWKDITLRTGESKVLVLTEDYRPLAVTLLLIVIILIMYFSMRSPVIVKKKAYGIHKKDTGNNEIKVLVHIRNRTGKTLEKVRVLERLPIIHKVEPDFGPGTPEPKFRRGHDGIVLDWDIVLAPHEERLFTYKIKSALPIVGEHTLRPTVVQYGHKGNRTSSEPYRIVLE